MSLTHRKQPNQGGEKANGHTPKTKATGKTVYELFETPFFWKFWAGAFLVIGIPWFMLMAYLLVQSDQGARQAMSFFNKGIAPKDQNYALDCGFASFYEKLFDVFTISHATGWFLSAMAFRSFPYTVLFSIIDELCEVWWRCCYPNFQECWWDHILLDIAFTNALGAYLGALFVNKVVGSQLFTWWDAMQNDKLGRKHFWTTCVWAKVLSFFCMFGFKWCLWIPSNNWINAVHMIAHGTIFFPVCAEAYGNLVHGTRNWTWSAIMWPCFSLDALVSCKMGYATPLFQNWDIWGKLLAGTMALITYPSFAAYFR